MDIRWKFFFLGLILSISSVSGAGEKCVVCDSATNDKCATNPQEITSTDCAGTECFTSVDNNGKIERGCVVAATVCDDVSCKKCTAAADACNIKIPFTCKTCDSSTDPNCAKNPSTFVNKICEEGITKCLVQIKDDKHTERRCVTKNDEACPAGKTCQICEGSSCNKEIFPSDRRRCYQCAASPKCGNPWANPADVLSLPCTLYDVTDKCYVYGTTADDMARGCASDVSFSQCTAAKEKCKQCDGSSCNGDAFKVSQSIKCIQCKEENADCPWGHEVSQAKGCINQIEFWQTEGCYTKKIDGGKAERGCINDAAQPFDCTTANGCASCSTGDGCNNIDVMDFSCYKCRSSENEKCTKPLTDAAEYSSEKCRNPVSNANKGCYTERWKDLVIRSCLVDADHDTRQNCLKDDYKDCVICTDKDCNKLAPPNSSQRIAVASSLLGMTYLVMRFF